MQSPSNRMAKGHMQWITAFILQSMMKQSQIGFNVLLCFGYQSDCPRGIFEGEAIGQIFLGLQYHARLDVFY